MSTDHQGFGSGAADEGPEAGDGKLRSRALGLA